MLTMNNIVEVNKNTTLERVTIKEKLKLSKVIRKKNITTR